MNTHLVRILGHFWLAVPDKSSQFYTQYRLNSVPIQHKTHYSQYIVTGLLGHRVGPPQPCKRASVEGAPSKAISGATGGACYENSQKVGSLL